WHLLLPARSPPALRQRGRGEPDRAPAAARAHGREGRRLTRGWRALDPAHVRACVRAVRGPRAVPWPASPRRGTRLHTGHVSPGPILVRPATRGPAGARGYWGNSRGDSRGDSQVKSVCTAMRVVTAKRRSATTSKCRARSARCAAIGRGNLPRSCLIRNVWKP